MQDVALPLLCQHVCIYLSDLPDEPGPLAGRHEALPVSAAEEKEDTVHRHVGDLDHGLPLCLAHALLPQVCICVCVFIFLACSSEFVCGHYRGRTINTNSKGFFTFQLFLDGNLALVLSYNLQHRKMTWHQEHFERFDVC